MKTKHTPAPWNLESNQEWPFKMYVGANTMDIATIEMAHYSTKDNTIDDCIRRDPLNAEQIANAKLISAAPELLNALNGILAKYVDLVMSGDAGSWNPEKEEEVIKAREAIQKATE